MADLLYQELSFKIVGLAMQVHTELGYGFLEKVYENSLMILFKENNIKAEQQKSVKIDFHGHEVGFYIADILVNDSIILEIKVCQNLTDIHKSQVANYLKATGKRLGILLNFGKEKLAFERVVI